MLLSAQWFNADYCVKAGFALEVFPDHEFMQRVTEKATCLARLPSSSLLQTKALLVGPQRQAMQAAVKAENLALDKLQGQPANVEAVAAFLQKREPDFCGL